MGLPKVFKPRKQHSAAGPYAPKADIIENGSK